MNRNEQIEEMSWIITFKAFEQAHLENGDDYLSDIVATELYDKGYSKASEVAREIFAEIENIILAGISKDEHFREQMNIETDRSYFEGGANSQRKVLTLVRQLKKKYLKVQE